MLQHKLLCVGRDVALMDSRARVLSTQFDVKEATGAEAMRNLAATEVFDLILLCHSLRGAERLEALSFARERWPQAKVLAMDKSGVGRLHEGVDAVVGALEGPRALLRSVGDLVAARPVASGQGKVHDLPL